MFLSLFYCKLYYSWRSRLRCWKMRNRKWKTWKTLTSRQWIRGRRRLGHDNR